MWGKRWSLLDLNFRGGAMMRSNPSEKWKPPITESRRRQVQRSGPAAILSKFRKDGNLESKLGNYWLLWFCSIFFFNNIYVFEKHEACVSVLVGQVYYK